MRRYTVYHIALMLFASVMLQGCQRDQLDDCITSSGPERSETRYLADFNTIEISDYTDIYITQNLGEPLSAKVTAGSNLLGQIETSVTWGVLHIKNNNVCNWVRNFKQRTSILLNVHNLNQIRTTGDAAITGSDLLTLDNVNIINEGSNDIYLFTHAGYLTLQQKLQGDITIDGSATVEIVLVEGVGKVNCGGCRSAYVFIKHYGKNNITVDAWKGLEVYLYNSGNVFYVLQEPAEFKRVAILGTGFVVLK